jgi:predicted  nucleic acid-binding Zn-ribbon protein
VSEQKSLLSLLSLIAFDKKIHDAKNTIDKEQSEISALNSRIENLDKELALTIDTVQQNEKAVHTIEKTAAELAEKERAKGNKLLEIASNKEHLSIKREIEYLKQQQHDLEKELMDTWKRLEKAQKAADEQKKAVETEQAELVTKRSIHEATLANTQKLLDELSGQRRPQETGIREEWLERYNVMKMVNSDPLALVVGQTCSACFYPLTAQDIVDLDRKKLIECRQCYRFLCRQEDLS